jgi:hypothetical protein
VRHDIDIDTAFREAVLGSGIPSDWLVDEDQAQQAKDAERQAAAQQAAAQQQLAAAGAVADVAARGGEAVQALQGAGVV